MIFIPTDHLKAGMVLAMDIDIGIGKLPLLTKEQVLTPGFIQRIRDLNIAGVYIESKQFEDVAFKETISRKLKQEALTNIKKIFENFSRKTLVSDASLKTISNLASSLVENILSNNEVVVNLSDLKGHDDYTYSHSLSVAILSIMIGNRLGFGRRLLTDLAAAALLHDLGKMKIDVRILNKQDKLTDEEFEALKEHPDIACDHLRKSKIFSMSVLEGVGSHHERYDGSGYPKALVADGIPLFGRILAVADVYDAITSNRSYRKAWFANEAIEYMMANAEIHFDFDILKAFLKSVAVYPVGTFVTLSNGQTALIIKNQPGNTLRPVIRIVGEDGSCTEDIDLMSDFNYISITITGRCCDSHFFDLGTGSSEPEGN
ncbi:MAG TPA: hypothetical protein DIT32_09260 [Peptococcaceae bacterium]|nr:hypothetical protein [Peptococcaceae bacterium]